MNFRKLVEMLLNCTCNVIATGGPGDNLGYLVVRMSRQHNGVCIGSTVDRRGYVS